MHEFVEEQLVGELLVGNNHITKGNGRHGAPVGQILEFHPF
jgi:hypothetical protein